jgi:aspartate aminotransferase
MFIWYDFHPQSNWIARADLISAQTKNGRISMAGLNTHNIDYFARAVDNVVRETQ